MVENCTVKKMKSAIVADELIRTHKFF